MSLGLVVLEKKLFTRTRTRTPTPQSDDIKISETFFRLIFLLMQFLIVGTSFNCVDIDTEGKNTAISFDIAGESVCVCVSVCACVCGGWGGWVGGVGVGVGVGGGGCGKRGCGGWECSILY